MKTLKLLAPEINNSQKKLILRELLSGLPEIPKSETGVEWLALQGYRYAVIDSINKFIGVE